MLVAYQDTNAIALSLPPLDKLEWARQKQAQEKACDAISQAFQTLRTAPHLLSTHQRQIVDNCQASIEKMHAARRARFEAELAERADRAAAAAAAASEFMLAAEPTDDDGATAAPVHTRQVSQAASWGGFSHPLSSLSLRTK